MRIRPLHDLLAVRLLPVDEKYGDLFLPEVARDKPRFGEIVAVGAGRYLENGERQPIGVQVGDRVALYLGDGVAFQLDGEELRIIRETNVLGVVEHSTNNQPRRPA